MDVSLVVEVVPPGADATDHIAYAEAGIVFYWRIEHAVIGVPIVYTYLLDPAKGRYQDGEVFTGIVKVTAPFVAEVDLGRI